MSIDTSDEINSVPPILDEIPSSPMSAEQWETLRQRILSTANAGEARRMYGKSAKRGGVYRWGVAAATGDACDALTDSLSRLACDAQHVQSNKGSNDLSAAAESFLARIDSSSMLSSVDGAHAVLWSAALPALSGQIEQQQWWRLLGSLVQLRESIMQRSDSYAPSHLMLCGELGLTLAWRLGVLPFCKSLQSTSIDAVQGWCDQEDESIASAIAQGTDTRLILASFDRCRRLIKKDSNRRLSKQQVRIGQTLSTWVAAMTTHTGGTAFSTAARNELADDLLPYGLLSQAVKYHPEGLRPAISAALGAKQTGGRLVWQVDLPESMHHHPGAKIAVMFPDWDVRRGRAHVDYSREEIGIEIFAGRAEVIAGDWQTMIELDGEEQQACGDWAEVCEFSDDDVHYLEIEQPWTGGVTLQRQILLIRDDRCLLLADAVLPSGHSEEPSQSIRYSSRIPLSETVRIKPEGETREVFLHDGRRRGLVVPLSASEWQIGPTDATLKETADGHLLLSTQGLGRLYAPLWFDFQQRRFDRMRTWRQLTIADQLQITDRDEAAGYRMQVGSEQWVVYRSLAEDRCRSVLGKHLNGGFYASRFDPSDGSHDALVTVDDSDSRDD
jgi:hypothetical protein